MADHMKRIYRCPYQPYKNTLFYYASAYSAILAFKLLTGQSLGIKSHKIMLGNFWLNSCAHVRSQYSLQNLAYLVRRFEMFHCSSLFFFFNSEGKNNNNNKFFNKCHDLSVLLCGCTVIFKTTNFINSFWFYSLVVRILCWYDLT